MEQKLGRELTKNEHVDHIDNDFTNDAIENLQVLTQKENNQKAFKFHGREAVLIMRTCDFCKMDFARPKAIYTNKKQSRYFCTENCRAKSNGRLISLGLLNNQPLWRNANASDLRSDTERFVGSTPARGTNLDENQ